ncbi:MAG: chromate resistance protein [Candidatus Rokubacteria bacterium]|nr:chromate resistance protein [Candidatus Rokubacteria bacterium]
MPQALPGAAGWLLLMLSLPPHPSSVRVRMWRKLRALGAVALRPSAYLLPVSAEGLERFQWLAQEVQKAGGEATLLRVDRIENMPRDHVVRLFQQARDEEYRALADRYRRLARGLERGAAGRRASGHREEMMRLAREAERVRSIDFFEAPGYEEVSRLRDTLEMRLHPREARPAASGGPALDVHRGSPWVTRPRPHVDRIASAWLIKRFIDPEAEFLFAPPEQFPAGAVPFDALGAEFGHQGEDCTFETLLGRSGLPDRRLAGLAEIVHDADLRDDKFGREEARGLDLALRGLLAALPDDHAVLAHGMTIFDGLYATIAERR